MAGDGGYAQINLDVAAKDFSHVANTFFGDRPLDNPGYSQMTLKGEVKVGSTDRLDIYKVEQRLKYLGFPAMGTNSPVTDNTIQDFDVNGKFEVSDQAALRLFEKVVRYGTSGMTTSSANATKDTPAGFSAFAKAKATVTSVYTLATSSYTDVVTASKVTPAITSALTAAAQTTENARVLAEAVRLATSAARENALARVKAAVDASKRFYTTSVGADGQIEADNSNAQGQLSTEWLNAYNAPHWVQFFAGTGNATGAKFQSANNKLPGWSNSQFGTTAKNVEVFGTSWMYDLMAARQYAPTQLRTGQNVTFNGSVDANLGKTPKGYVPGGMHGSHDLGMAFDMDVSRYIADANQGDATDGNRTIAATTGGWSVGNATTWSGYLPHNSGNGQRQALRDFLSLYALTQSDGWADLNENFTNGVAARNALFGEGNQTNGLISSVLIGGKGTQNPYPNMRKVLTGLEIDNDKSKDHQNHFHIYLRPPQPVPMVVTHNLMVDAVGAVANQADERNDLYNVAQEMLIQVAAEMNTNEGDIDMFVLDMANIPPQGAPVMMVQASQAKHAATQKERTLGVCQLIGNPDPEDTAVNVIDPTASIRGYFYAFEHQRLFGEGQVTILKNPTHGILDDLVGGGYRYVPTGNYLGKDSATILVEMAGYSIKLVYAFHVLEGPLVGDTSDLYRALCPKKVRKISTLTLDTSADNLATWQRASDLSSLLASASQTFTGFADLPGTSVGNTVGEGVNATITLDTIAAGHGWYVDPTPLDNTDDYLPTSNPNVWQAKAGTDAAGKMDMLSVLLHEYGHALGLVHSADGRDFMATTLQPGERRLPSSEELTLMSQLVAQLKADSSAMSTDPANPDAPSSPTAPLPCLPFAGLGLFALGRLRSDRYGMQTLFAPNGSVLAAVPQYEVAANTTLTNGQFNTSNGSLNSAQGWATEGSVAIEAGAATLNESATQQTRLNQVFIVGPQDRYLSFTLSNLALDDAATGPDDAFEVALLNANTGASLSAQTSDIGLTHTDALLNLQASGAELAASGVTHVTHPDGSRTYLVDLAGIAAGTAVNLSFDLIGFGSTAPNLGSHATVSHVRLMGMAQTRDDSVVTFEDTVVQIIALANDIDANQAGMAPVIVAAPQHGQVVVNPDGTFSYTPVQDYFGTDSFTYRLSNGVVDSNVSTVTLTITPVNDAPVAFDMAGPQTTLTEDSTLTIDLLTGANDAEGAPLVASIVSGPLHGSLVQNGDGTVTYTADANYFGLDSFTYRVSDGEADSSLASVSLTVTAVNDAPVASSAETDQRARFKFKNFLKQKHHLAQARQA